MTRRTLRINPTSSQHEGFLAWFRRRNAECISHPYSIATDASDGIGAAFGLRVLAFCFSSQYLGGNNNGNPRISIASATIETRNLGELVQSKLAY